jgi:hypothetical protein
MNIYILQHLESVKQIFPEDKFKRVEDLTEDFRVILIYPEHIITVVTRGNEIF